MYESICWSQGVWFESLARQILKMEGRERAMLVAAGVVALLGLLNVVMAVPEAARIISVPGFSSELPSAHYGGYMTIDEAHGRELFYYFVTSESSTAATDPLVLWLNGGPGCSSFDGFIYEHGPFLFEPAANPKDLPKLTLNPYSWSKIVNIIYLDSPAGVGFSFSKNKSDYLTGDLKTASDTYKFLLKWIMEYPEYQSNPLYVIGESYAGIYVPTLSREIVHGIEAGASPVLNFKGYAVGNGCTDDEYDGNALVPFVHGMGLISSELYEGAVQACHGNYWNASTDECIQKLTAIELDIRDINVYDILEPCYHSPKSSDRLSSQTRLPSSFRKLGETQRPLPTRIRMFGRAWPLYLPNKAGRVPTWGMLTDDLEVPCTDDTVANAWLNSPFVREALHANSIKEIGNWELCTDNIIFYHDAGSMIPIHKYLTSKGYKALVYSGDHDMCVPYTGSEAWTRGMGYTTIDQWRPWFVDDQVAGYTQGYENHLTFATIKGSGHTVPEYKPAESLAFLHRWLKGEAL